MTKSITEKTGSVTRIITRSNTITDISSHFICLLRHWGIIEKYRHNWVNVPTNIGVLSLFASQEDGQLKHKYRPIDPNSFSCFDLRYNNWSQLTAIYVSDVDQPVRCFQFVLNWDRCVNFRFKSIAKFSTTEIRQTACFLLKRVGSSFFSTCTFNSGRNF